MKNEIFEEMAVKFELGLYNGEVREIDTFKVVSRPLVPNIQKDCKKHGVKLEDFLSYMRAKKEVADDTKVSSILENREENN